MDPEVAQARRERRRARMGLSPSPQASTPITPSTPAPPVVCPTPSLSAPTPIQVPQRPAQEKPRQRKVAHSPPTEKKPTKPPGKWKKLTTRVHPILIFVLAVLAGIFTPTYGFPLLLAIDFLFIGGVRLARALFGKSPLDTVFALLAVIRDLWARFHVITFVIIASRLVAAYVQKLYTTSSPGVVGTD